MHCHRAHRVAHGSWGSLPPSCWPIPQEVPGVCSTVGGFLLAYVYASVRLCALEGCRQDLSQVRPQLTPSPAPTRMCAQTLSVLRAAAFLSWAVGPLVW